MKQDKLSKWLKFIIIGVGLCGLVVYAFVVPSIGQSFSYDYPEFSGYYLPWIIFISLTSVPVLVALCLCWKIADNIGNVLQGKIRTKEGLQSLESLCYQILVLFQCRA